MKTSDLSIKELAAIIGVSTDTIRRATRRGGDPLNTCWQGLSVRSTPGSAPDGTQRRCLPTAEIGWRAGRREPTARHAERPRLVTRGHYPQGSLQEV